MATQLPLLGHEPFVPLPHGESHYVPILQSQVGELRALLEASPAVWDRITPVVHVVGRRKLTAPLNRGTVREWVKKIHDTVGDRPVFLDILRPVPTYPVSSRGRDIPLLCFLYEQARKRGLTFVPVLHVGTKYEAAQAKIVEAAALQDGRGVALHCPADIVLPSGTSVSDYLTAALASVARSPVGRTCGSISPISIQTSRCCRRMSPSWSTSWLRSETGATSSSRRP